MRLCCVGNALVDVSAEVPAGFSGSLGLRPGSTEHVPREAVAKALSRVDAKRLSAGGGAANSARAYAALGGPASFFGVVSDDDWATAFRHGLSLAGVEPELRVAEGGTGLFVAFFEPDATKTIIVNPGSSLSASAEDLPGYFFADGSALYLNGFTAQAPGFIEGIAVRAAECDAPLAFDVAGKRLAASERKGFLKLIRERCAWTFMNEDEYVALAEDEVESSLRSFSKDNKGLIVVKRAEAGAVCVRDGELYESPVRSLRGMDTTGSGDAFAAGFLAGVFSGASLPRCLRLANWTAEHVIQLGPTKLRRDCLKQGLLSLVS